ncbi:alpha/beta hydrolase [Dictyobacter alpinus]|uniref:Alpha/beta hydrolase n=1 Tax=Dictyobacter alpinus TaxID=2014873 RepID=A0A402BDP9_9CHLR|nr:alpha/beta hydrolase [Dictyobacter alpinus]GCE29561.1 alpha/beta hydrolase [Dictyobacter alpinus]
MSRNVIGKHAPINGINLYYEIHGTGTPFIMLHGGMGSFTMLNAISSDLIENYQIIGVDLYGHGRTPLTDRPIRIEDMADDIAGLIEYLGFPKADMLGYSLGADVAIQTAIRHRERVNKLVVISTAFKRSAWYPEIQQGMSSMAPEQFIGTPMYEEYQKVAPRPEDFARFVASMTQALSQDYDWTDLIPTITAPTLIIAGDSDSFPPSHAAEFFRLLGGGQKDAGWNGENLIPSQLAILPHATHYNIVFQPALLLPIITSFLS